MWKDDLLRKTENFRDNEEEDDENEENYDLNKTLYLTGDTAEFTIEK